MEHDVTLNIHYTIPDKLWKKLIPSMNKLTENGIEFSVEPGGLQLWSENSTEQEWNFLIEEFCKNASEILGFPVGDICDDFDCIPFNYR